MGKVFMALGVVYGVMLMIQIMSGMIAARKQA